MRYYPLFRRAIPHSRVGYPRVTHPFAARLAGCPAASLDLHVLGAPPAFILSQDQTLQFEPVNTADPAAGRILPCVIRVSVLQVLDVSSTVAPHARFSFQRTSTRPSRRTSSVVADPWSVNPWEATVVTTAPTIVVLQRATPPKAGNALYRRAAPPCQPPGSTGHLPAFCLRRQLPAKTQAGQTL